jgi:LPXTG-motif cell wall-anchored protein
MAVAGLALAGVHAASATQPNPEHKVTICHAHPADSLTGPWVSITVDVASVGYQHQGHQSEHDGDIIPPYQYTDVEGTTFIFEGKGDQAILENGCAAIDVSPTPTPTTPPPTSPPPTKPPTCHDDGSCFTPTWHPTWQPTGGPVPGEHPLAQTGIDPKSVAAAVGLLGAGLGLSYLARRRSEKS